MTKCERARLVAALEPAIEKVLAREEADNCWKGSDTCGRLAEAVVSMLDFGEYSDEARIEAGGE